MLNLQGDVVKLIWYIPGFEYQKWPPTSTTHGQHPHRHRQQWRKSALCATGGYYYDTETGLYYVSSRYYDPEVGRYLNARAGYVSTGQGIPGNNMFALLRE
ncbi:MAG: hypothetical protein ACLRR6_04990 [Oscillospiraceae bacterium]